MPWSMRALVESPRKRSALDDVSGRPCKQPMWRCFLGRGSRWSRQKRPFVFRGDRRQMNIGKPTIDHDNVGTTAFQLLLKWVLESPIGQTINPST